MTIKRCLFDPFYECRCDSHVKKCDFCDAVVNDVIYEGKFNTYFCVNCIKCNICNKKLSPVSQMNGEVLETEDSDFDQLSIEKTLKCRDCFNSKTIKLPCNICDNFFLYSGIETEELKFGVQWWECKDSSSINKGIVCKNHFDNKLFDENSNTRITSVYTHSE